MTSPTKEPFKDRRKQLLQEVEDLDAQAKAPAKAGPLVKGAKVKIKNK